MVYLGPIANWIELGKIRIRDYTNGRGNTGDLRRDDCHVFQDYVRRDDEFVSH
jgi:hypothetical protein